MKLSEAIRLGAMLKPQAFDQMSDGVGTCALGAAAQAVGCKLWPPQAWEYLLDLTQECPECGFSFWTFPVVTHLNDDHRWTRERIADWVESVELRHAVIVAQPTGYAATGILQQSPNGVAQPCS